MRLTGHDDRVRDSIDQLRTKTGRFYRPLHTVKKEGPMRSFFKARPGYKFVRADYSQQEVRVIAGLANDKKSIAVFKSGKDIYLEVAASITGKPAHQCGKHRKIAKEIVLGLNNGRGIFSIYQGLNDAGVSIDLDDVTGLILRYNNSYSKIYEWRQ